MPSGFVTYLMRLKAHAGRLVPVLALLVVPLVPLPAAAQSTGQQKISPALLADMTANPTALIPVIIEMNPLPAPFTSGMNQTLAQQAVSILQANGQAFGGLSIIQGAAGVATAVGIVAMSQLPQIATIEEDSFVHARRPTGGGSLYNGSGASQLSSLYVQEVNAPRVWQHGGSGKGVTVAVVDSGVANDIDLGNGNRVLTHINFAGPTNAQQPDPGGHGSHIAGTIAGDGTRSNGQYIGMAPQASIVDVKVLDQNGNGRISSVLRGLEWVLAHQHQFSIRIVNLSLGAPASGSYKYDPIAAASEILWRRGVVVVAASGNLGPQSGTVESPGTDPYVITVGSTDDLGQLPLINDLLGWWSSWGTPTDSTAKPDLIAPGRRVVSIDVPGSLIDTRLSDHVVYASNGARYIRLTGTSMSTAVMSGAVALLLEHQPGLTPDQVKKILASSSQSFGVGPMPAGAGTGLLDANAATFSGVRGNPNTGQRHANALGRTLYSVVYGQPLAWKSLTYLGTNWAPLTWPNLPWTDPTWDNIAWDNIAWDNIAWDNIAWDNIAWDNIAWDNIAWDSTEWNDIAWDNIGWD